MNKTGFSIYLMTVIALSLIVCRSGMTSPDPDLHKLILDCKKFENNPQFKPFKTNVFCRGKRTYWELQSSDAFSLETANVVYHRAEMKDGQYQLTEKEYGVPNDPTWLSCHLFREMLVAIPSTVMVINDCKSLEDMAAIGRDEFCRKSLENVLGEDPVPTGNTYTTCPNGGGGTLNLGASFKDVVVKNGEDIEQGPKIASILDPQGIIAEIGLNVGDMILYINKEKIPGQNALTVKLNALKGKGLFEMIVLKAETNQLIMTKASL